MKKMILAVMLVITGLFSIPALAVDISANAGAETNYVFRSQTMSERGFSANFNVKAKADSGLYGSYGLHTVSFAGNNANLFNIVEGGYSTKLANIADVSAGYTYYAFTGGANRGVAVNNSNFGEVFAQASAYGVSAKYAQRVTMPVGATGHDEYFRLAYVTKVAEKCTIGAGYERQNFQTAGKVGSEYDVTAGYAFTPAIGASLSYVHAGNGVNGIKLPNQVSVGVNYKF